MPSPSCVRRWALLPVANPLMAFVPQIAFFLAHLLSGLVVGIVLAIAFRRPAVAGMRAQAVCDTHPGDVLLWRDTRHDIRRFDGN